MVQCGLQSIKDVQSGLNPCFEIVVHHKTGLLVTSCYSPCCGLRSLVMLTFDGERSASDVAPNVSIQFCIAEAVLAESRLPLGG